MLHGVHPGTGLASARFESSLVFFAAWFVVGLYLDGWAHSHGRADTFFTPWHATLYSGFLGAAGVLVGGWATAPAHRRTLRRTMPRGYGLSLVGVGIFALGGVGDLVWHQRFGVEADLAALYSPPHLLLATGGFLIVSGPWRAAWAREAPSRGGHLRAVLSLTLMLAILTFFTGEFHPLVHPSASVDFRPPPTPFLHPRADLPVPARLATGGTQQDVALTLGMSGILFQAALLVALVMSAVRRWGPGLPAGWLTGVLGLNALGLSIFHDTYWAIPVAGLSGAIADALYRGLRPDTQRPMRARLLGAGIPFVLYSVYFAALWWRGGTWWAIHVWTGGIVLAAVTGWLVTLLIVPPPLPDQARGHP